MLCGQGNGPASRSAVHPGAALVATSYTVGGTLSGISGTVVLQDNGGDDLSLSADGPFTFGTPLADGSTYAGSVLAQPQGQTCTVANGNGTISSANVTDVTVTCTPIVCAGWFTGYCMVDDRTGLLTGECWDPGTCPWPKLDLKAVDQTVARSALSAMALKNGGGQRIAAERSVTAVSCVDTLCAA